MCLCDNCHEILIVDTLCYNNLLMNSGIPEKYSEVGLSLTLQRIAHDVVETLGYIGALVATYEEDDALPIQAVYINPHVASVSQVREWESRVSRLMRRPVSLFDPQIARVYVHDEQYANNLSVKAVRAREPVVSNDLFDLLTPVIPQVTRPIIKLIQNRLKIQQVIAVPFFLESFNNDPAKVVGNLFAATTDVDGFGKRERDILHAFGRQAAIAIWNAQLYRKAEERRKVSEVFARMAFGAAANVHALSNHIGAFRVYFQMLSRVASEPSRLQSLLGSSERYLERLNKAADILSNLHEPWSLMPDTPVDVNHALERALSKVGARLNLEERIKVHLSLDPELPQMQASYDMLVEAFRILIAHGMETILADNGQLSSDMEGNVPVEEQTAVSPTGHLYLTSDHTDTTIVVSIRNDRSNLDSYTIGHLFELHGEASRKGFGLFWLKDYIEGINGRIEVTSQAGEGTTFHLFLPVEV